MPQYPNSKAKSESSLASADSGTPRPDASTVSKESKQRKLRLPKLLRRSRSPESEESVQAPSLRNATKSWKIKISNHDVTPEDEARYMRTREVLLVPQSF